MNNNYEIHATVPHERLDRLRALVRYVEGVRVLSFLNLYGGGSYKRDVMTTKNVRCGSLGDAEHAANEHAQFLRSQDMQVLRLKIETEPWHVQAAGPLTEEQYFETHLRVIGADVRVPGVLRSVADGHGSRYCTIRTRKTLTHHLKQTDLAVAKMLGLGCQVVNAPHVEFAVRDSDSNYDAAWERASGKMED